MSRFLTIVLIGAGVGLNFVGQDALAEDASSTTILPQTTIRFGGPDAVPSQLRNDARKKDTLTGQDVLLSYREWKERFRERTGISYTLDYTTAGLFPSNTISGENSFNSGAVRFYGQWELVGRGSDNTGTFVWKVENRHGYSGPPVSAAAADIGLAGAMLSSLSDAGNRLTNFYWKQNLRGGRLEIIGGMLDVTDWTDVYALASPWTGFFNFAFGTGGAAMALPDDAALGLFVNGMITDNLYFVTGFADANADSTDPMNGFDTIGDGEFFKTLEIGWVTSQDRFYLDNTHLTLWHIDERQAAGVPDGWGVNFSYSRSFDEKWMPFFRAGYAKDGGTILQKSVSAGFAHHFGAGDSLLGFGVNWGQPNETTYGPGLSDQYTVELFTRLQVSENIQITPDVQYIKNPALNPTANHSLVLGLRMRAVF
ncbi:carbohydrate porin [Ruegeria sp. Alg231-54]|uniref:carbohydrate porin n=1 Tax=Ruegeria sp. Alg231-54 TaxID=1922221 RepID=UPI00131F3D74|nr:carbohydrate porin [Ruegeria sp. Alg231-54]